MTQQSDNLRATQSDGAMCMVCWHRKATHFVMVGKRGNIKKYRCNMCKPGKRGGGISMFNRKETP